MNENKSNNILTLSNKCYQNMSVKIKQEKLSKKFSHPLCTQLMVWNQNEILQQNEIQGRKRKAILLKEETYPLFQIKQLQNHQLQRWMIIEIRLLLQITDQIWTQKRNLKL